MISEAVRQMKIADFLDYAEGSEHGYELIDGEPRQMFGGTLNHFRIIHEIQVLLSNRLADSDCQVIASGMLVKTGAARLLAPDVSVVCGRPQTEAGTRLLLNPILVVEVSSPSSRDYDRVSKRQCYWDLASIEAYLVVDQGSAYAELYTRGERDWHARSYAGLEADIPLAALGCSLALRDVYQRIDFDDAAVSGLGR